MGLCPSFGRQIFVFFLLLGFLRPRGWNFFLLFLGRRLFWEEFQRLFVKKIEPSSSNFIVAKKPAFVKISYFLDKPGQNRLKRNLRLTFRDEFAMIRLDKKIPMPQFHVRNGDFFIQFMRQEFEFRNYELKQKQRQNRKNFGLP